MKRLLVGLGILILLGLLGVGIWWTTLGGGLQQGPTVPVVLSRAKNVGSLQMELAYDPAVLEATEVKAGELAKNAMVEYNLAAPGRLVVGVIDSSGMNGTGPVVTISFKVLDKRGTSAIILETIQANDATTLIDMPVKASAGSYAARDGSFTAPVIGLSP